MADEERSLLVRYRHAGLLLVPGSAGNGGGCAQPTVRGPARQVLVRGAWAGVAGAGTPQHVALSSLGDTPWEIGLDDDERRPGGQRSTDRRDSLSILRGIRDPFTMASAIAFIPGLPIEDCIQSICVPLRSVSDHMDGWA